MGLLMGGSGGGGNRLTAKPFYCSVALLRASLGWHDLCRGLKSVKGGYRIPENALVACLLRADFVAKVGYNGFGRWVFR